MKFILVMILKVYKKVLSPILEKLLGGGCRFYPTCSEYAMESINKYGVLKGGFLATRRFLRCNSLSSGFYDPVPRFQPQMRRS
ncbi:membrane protein insertion efficiency factor YidD [Candidatus Woesebacteria bacterium RIFCSPHIGHO2_01_FULL_38_9]|uniref:Putative membrane protein insertion efficiency factor n=2 Tax=Candidatus Woeseibacteriota TaxID=1752722 RepID=A0A1F7Y0P4_9BACT|nr:MAG: membrane protein insertion efficiency factor YidD [Candidatus Woesebacteria bacterium RIFCSPHIGHO2_01_FULL_38_9]OGM59150.1 MAG: membrane protein insertion efficiency factor YidD [Candidatus Woesebacteria bacterium RIFCSPLOWO2_01_FULL_39_10]